MYEYILHFIIGGVVGQIILIWWCVFGLKKEMEKLKK
jgi:hypothetical protein